MGLETISHPRPYAVEWVKKGPKIKVDRQCILKFAVTKAYIDEVVCDVVPLDVSQVILGSSYIFDRDGVYYRRAQKYRFVKDGRKVYLKSVKTAPTNQATCVGVVALMARAQEPEESLQSNDLKKGRLIQEDSRPRPRCKTARAPGQRPAWEAQTKA